LRGLFFIIAAVCGKKFKEGQFLRLRRKGKKNKTNTAGDGLLTSRRFLFRLSLVFLLACFSVFYNLLLFDLFAFFVYFFVFPPLADIFLPPLFYPAFAGYISLIFSGLIVSFWLFLVRSVGFFVFPVPAVGGTFLPSFFSLSAILYF
jgi:hypothetical protein